MSFFEIDLDRKRIPTTTATIKTKNPSQQGRSKDKISKSFLKLELEALEPQKPIKLVIKSV